MDYLFSLLILCIIPLLIGYFTQKYQRDNRLVLTIDQLSHSYWNGASACCMCALIAYFLMAIPVTIGDLLTAGLRLAYWSIMGYATTCGFWYLSRHKKPAMWINIP